MNLFFMKKKSRCNLRSKRIHGERDGKSREGKQYKNVSENQLVQSQEFYGKKFLVKDKLQEIKWKTESESKQIGNYLCFRATAVVPSKELSWINFLGGI